MFPTPTPSFVRLNRAGQVVSLCAHSAARVIAAQLQQKGARLARARGKDTHHAYRYYQSSRASAKITRGRAAAICQAAFLAFYPAILTARASEPRTWTNIAAEVAENQKPAQADAQDHADWVLAHLEVDPTPGSYVLRADVLRDFTGVFPGPEQRQGAALLNAVKTAGFFLPGPQGRLIANPALCIGGKRTKVLYGLRRRAVQETQLTLSDNITPAFPTNIFKSA